MFKIVLFAENFISFSAEIFALKWHSGTKKLNSVVIVN